MNNSQLLLIDETSNDLTPEELPLRVAMQFGRDYLSEYENQTDETQGIVWGPSGQFLVCLPVSRGDRKKLAVFFLVDTKSPLSYLSKQAIDALSGKTREFYGQFRAKIWGHTIWVKASKNQNEGLNILGADFLRENYVELFAKYNLMASKENVMTLRKGKPA